jgi:hypothetical protein
VSKRGNRQIGSLALNLLGLRLGFSAGAFGPISLPVAAAKANALGAGFLEASSAQKVKSRDSQRSRLQSIAERSNGTKEQAGSTAFANGNSRRGGGGIVTKQSTPEAQGYYVLPCLIQFRFEVEEKRRMSMCNAPFSKDKAYHRGGRVAARTAIK